MAQERGRDHTGGKKKHRSQTLSSGFEIWLSHLTRLLVVVRSSGRRLEADRVPPRGAQGDALRMSGCFPVAGLRCLSRVSVSLQGSLRLRPQPPSHHGVEGALSSPFLRPTLISAGPPLIPGSFHPRCGVLVLDILNSKDPGPLRLADGSR